MLQDEDEFIEYIKSVKYLVIFPDQSCKMFFTFSLELTQLYNNI